MTLRTDDLLDELARVLAAQPAMPGGAAPEGVHESAARDLLNWQRRHDALRLLLGERLVDEALAGRDTPAEVLEEVYVVFDGPPGPSPAGFVETELADGTGVGFDGGPSWMQHVANDDLWMLGPFLVPAAAVRRA